MFPKGDYINAIVKRITRTLDLKDKKNDSLIDINDWKNFAQKNGFSGIEINKYQTLTTKEAEQLIRQNLQMHSHCYQGQMDLVDLWFSNLMEQDIKRTLEQPNDATAVNRTISPKQAIPMLGNEDKGTHKLEAKIKLKLKQDILKNKVVNNMYKKWSSAAQLKDSPLKKEFYDKLYDVIKVLNCTIPDTDWNRNTYNTKEEQVMDEVIAILAGESNLNPKQDSNPPFIGLFQLKNCGLVEIKAWAKKHPDFYGMNNINQNLSMSGFKKISGEEQLDYLVAFIGKTKEYSKIKENEFITPAQLWAMIKGPFDGKNNNKVTAKISAINKVFKAKNISRGVI